MREPLLLGILTALLAYPPLSARAEHVWFTNDPPLFCLSIGAAEIFDSHQELFWGIEYRPAFRLYHFGPWLFIGSGKDDAFYAAIGFLIHLELGHDWVLTPSFGGGYYNAEEGLDLGFDTEFRSGIELAKRFRNGHRIGLSFSHLSNGSLSERNPGTETFGLIYSIPLRARLHPSPPPAPSNPSTP